MEIKKNAKKCNFHKIIFKTILEEKNFQKKSKKHKKQKI